MPNPTWPATLPQYVLSAGYGEAPPNNVVRTAMEAGPAKVRRRYSAAVRRIKCQIQCSAAQVEAFEVFHRVSLGDGVLPFDWLHPRTRATCTFRVVEVGEYVHVGGDLWRIPLELEILP